MLLVVCMMCGKYSRLKKIDFGEATGLVSLLLIAVILFAFLSVTRFCDSQDEEAGENGHPQWFACDLLQAGVAMDEAEALADRSFLDQVTLIPGICSASAAYAIA